MLRCSGAGLIVLLASGGVRGAANEQRRPTYATDVAPIVHAHCVSCHRPGRAAPFPLLSYDDVRVRGKEMVAAVSARHMPPWSATPRAGYQLLNADRRLTSRQIETLTNWVAADMPPGDLARAPLPPSFPTGWALGLPDITLTLPHVVLIPASSDPRIFNIVLPLNFQDDRWITAIDYQPSSQGLVSHALFFAVGTDVVVDDADALPGFSGMLGSGPTANPGERLIAAAQSLDHLGVWTPGVWPARTPEGSGVRLRRRTHLVMQLHARGSDTGAIEDGRVAIYLSKTPPARALVALQVPPAFGIAAGIDIPAGAPRTVVTDRFTLPVDVEAVGARGHAHDRGRELKITARLPNGSTRGLLWIDRWNVRWQETYYFTKPLRLPRGTSIEVEVVYANPPAGAPGDSPPPRRIGWGPRLSDEIGGISLVITEPAADEAIVLADARARHLRDQLVRTGRQPK